MNKLRKAVLGFSKLTNLQVITLANVVADAINANPATFSTPDPSGDALKDAAVSAEASYRDAKHGNRDQRNRFKEDFQNLKNLLRTMCNYVNTVAKGNETIVELSGFNASKIPSPVPTPIAAKNISALYVYSPGKADVKWGGSQYHKYYVLQVTTDPTDGNSWKDVATLTGRRYMVQGLASGKLHYFRTVSVNSHGQSSISDVASVMVA